MTEINVIYQYCCIIGKDCSYNSGFQEGYLLGVLTFILVFSIVVCLLDFTEKYDEINKEKKDN